MKTKAQWDESQQDLGRFLQIGDVVDEEMADYFLCVLPPACMAGGIIQIGEPYSFKAGGETFMTIRKIGDSWVYAGCCHKGKGDEPGASYLDFHAAHQTKSHAAAGISPADFAAAAEYEERYGEQGEVQ
jgi:hypothetical protein